MRLALGAMVASLAVAGAASAQPNEGGLVSPTPDQVAAAPPSSCPAFPAPPNMPDGARARGEQIQAANRAVEAWDAASRDVFYCRLSEDAQLEQELMQIQARRLARRNEFDAGRSRFIETCERWFTEVNEFNERNGRPLSAADRNVSARCQ